MTRNTYTATLDVGRETAETLARLSCRIVEGQAAAGCREPGHMCVSDGSRILKADALIEPPGCDASGCR
ncbi:hypothetical protein [Streptomyces sp. NPDC047706]|uniref:hypothetical protein n=1 Tax=Streptomyces sp. NPDC047706 TaxID=3365486 RepID=UPI00371E9BA4